MVIFPRQQTSNKLLRCQHNTCIPNCPFPYANVWIDYGLLFTLITWVKNTRLGEKWRGHPRRGYLLTFIKVLIASAAPDYPVVLTYLP